MNKVKDPKFKDISDKTVPIVPMDNIVRWSAPTPKGNSLEVFYNRDTGLVVVDLIAANGEGGNEIFRKVLDEKALLVHLE